MFNNTYSYGPPTEKRQERRNIQQLEFMADYLVYHPEVATGKFTKLYARNKRVLIKNKS